MAQLEEFLQEKYVENYDEEDENASKVHILLNKYPNYFFIPKNYGFGSLDCIETGGKSLYCIKKAGLPKEIQESLIGGDAGDGVTYTTYAKLQDVYGVTEDLKVYYCEDGMSTIYGLNSSELDDIKDREVFKDTSRGLGKLLSEYSGDDGIVSSKELQGVKILEVTEEINFQELYNLFDLEEITIRNQKNIDIKGIENCPKINYIYFYDSSATDYEPMGNLSELKWLYFYNPTNEQITKLGDGLKNYDLSKLEYFGAFGYETNFDNQLLTSYRKNAKYIDDVKSELSDLSGLKNLSDVTKNSIKYMYLCYNSLENIDSLLDFHGVKGLNLNVNNLGNLSALKNMTNLTHLSCYDCALKDLVGDERIEENDALYSLQFCESLKWLNLPSNNDLIYLNYLKNLPLISLFMDNNRNLSIDDMLSLKDKINLLEEKYFEEKYSDILFDDNLTTELNYRSRTISLSDFRRIGGCKNLRILNFLNTTVKIEDGESLFENETNELDVLTHVFQNLGSLEVLDLSNSSFDLGDGPIKLKSLSFFTDSNGHVSCPKLRSLAILNTEVGIIKGENASDDVSINAQRTIKALESLTSLKNLFIDNDKFDFSLIQSTVSRLQGYAGDFSQYGNARRVGLHKHNKFINIRKMYKIRKIYGLG